MTVGHYNESSLGHIISQKFPKNLDNGKEFSGKMVKEFTLYKNN